MMLTDMISLLSYAPLSVCTHLLPLSLCLNHNLFGTWVVSLLYICKAPSIAEPGILQSMLVLIMELSFTVCMSSIQYDEINHQS